LGSKWNAFGVHLGVTLVSIWDPFRGDFGIHLGLLRCNFGKEEEEEEEDEEDE